MVTYNSQKEEIPITKEKVTVGSLLINTIVSLGGNNYRVTEFEAGQNHVELERVEKRNGQWEPKMYCADDENVIIPNDTLVTVI